jgi:hypothetical protein
LKEEHNLRTWEGFLTRLGALKRDHNNLLFRGQGNSRWPLETTLERRGHARMKVDAYYLLASKVQPQVESFTGRRFHIPAYQDIRKLFTEYDEFSRTKFPTEVFTYFIYARHHGFPSPLLDWTRSAYVAAFFAFQSENPDVKRRSIYVWIQARFKVGGTNRPELHRVGRYLRTHPRHVLQQCDYSMRATFQTDKPAHWAFTPHEGAFDGVGLSGERLVRFNIPSTERLKVLKYLDDFNLNAYSLFGSEDSLMHTMAIRELDLPGMKSTRKATP